MSKKYFVIDFKKIKTQAQFNNWLLGHNERKYKLQRENVNPERTPNNIILQALKYKSAADFIEQKKQEIKKLNEVNKKKRAELVKELVNNGMDKEEAQKLARKKFPKRRAPTNKQAIGFALVVDCSVMSGWTEENYINYLQEALKYIKERFKDIELLNAVIHLDESKPHLHVAFAYWSPEEKRFVEKKLFNKGISDLNALLSDFEAQVGKKFGLVRGDKAVVEKTLIKPLEKECKTTIEQVVNRKFFGLIPETRKVTAIKPSKVKTFLREKVKIAKELGTADKVIQLSKENKELQKYRDDFLSAVERIKQLERELQSKEKKISELENKVKTKEQELENKTNEISQLEQALLQEREKRLNIKSQFPERTIKKIRQDYGINR